MVLEMTSQEVAIADFEETSHYLHENAEGSDEACTQNVRFFGMGLEP